MTTGPQRMYNELCPFIEKPVYGTPLLFIECRKSGERRPYMTIKRRRNSPNATPAILVVQLVEFIKVIFLDAIRRICDYGMNAVGGHPA